MTRSDVASRPTFSSNTGRRTRAIDYVTPRTERIAVTPEIAEQWLGWYDDGTDTVYNRNPGTVWVVKLARDMKNDKWFDTGVPIIVGTHGKVLDGAQRLHAVILSGRTIIFDVRFGIDPRAQTAMDRPRRRSVGHDLHMEGVPNSTVVAATTVLLLHWRSGQLLDNRASPTDQEQLEFEREERDALQLACRQANRVRVRLPNVTLTVVAAAFFEAVLIDEDACITFFDKFATGRDLEDGDPILALRNITLREASAKKSKPHRNHQLYRVVYAWNLWREGKKKQYLRVPDTLTSDTFPRMG